MNEAGSELESLLSGLERAARGASRGDALDRILSAPPRSTQVTALRDHEVVQRFRRELTDGLIRQDSAVQLLGLIREVLEAVMKP